MVTACPIILVKPLPANDKPQEIHLCGKDKTLAWQHIQELIDKHAVVYSSREPRDFVSPVFLIPKKPAGSHLILNLSFFNNFAEKMTFKMETLQHILSMIEPNMYQSCVDLQDAFLTVPILRCHCLYLKFMLDGKILMYLTLPFGYTGSPCLFTKILRPLIARLRSLCHLVCFYLDDR